MERNNIFFVGFIVVSCLVRRVPAPGTTKMCRNCNEASSPQHCMEFHHCRESCMTQVHSMNGSYVFSFSCKGQHDCDHQTSLIGKRAHHPHEHGQLVCSECCNTNLCDADGCKNFQTSATSAPVTAMPASAGPDPVTPGIIDVTVTACTDTNTDPNLTCADMQVAGFCDPSSGAGYDFAKANCKKTCGFCT